MAGALEIILCSDILYVEDRSNRPQAYIYHLLSPMMIPISRLGNLVEIPRMGTNSKCQGC